MSLTLGADCTSSLEPHLPAAFKQVAGYTTGTPDIRWSPAQLGAHPGVVHICQDAGATDVTADVLDVESGAATNAEAGAWFIAATQHRAAGTRRGQRLPAIYTSLANVTPLVNALIAYGVHTGPRLWVAHWGISQATAAADITETGPFPIIGYQFSDPGPYDLDLWADDWLASGSPGSPPARPQWATDSIADLTGIATEALAVRTLLQNNT